MNKIAEFFGFSPQGPWRNWSAIVSLEGCPYRNNKCYKTRKSSPEISIGTCTVLYGRENTPTIICPYRLVEKRKIFLDCLHLMTMHEPGNELHIVSEVQVPGGSVDYFLVSVADGKIRDFVGIELQALDTTGTVWPERQRLLLDLGLPVDCDVFSDKSFGMNWKMTAKTILVQMHHKIQTFEHINKKLVLVVQDCLLSYMSKEFRFDHLSIPAKNGDSMHLHSYRMNKQDDGSFMLGLNCRLSTDAQGIAACLDLQGEARVELKEVLTVLQGKISRETQFFPFQDLVI